MKNLYVTKHAMERAVDRFNVKANQADRWIREKMKQAKHVGNILSGEQGEERRLFVSDGVGFILEPKADRLITCVVPHVNSDLNARIRGIIEKELRKIERQEARITRRNTLAISKLNVQMAECELRLLRARKNESVQAIKEQIETIAFKVAELKAEINDIKAERSKLVYGVSSYV